MYLTIDFEDFSHNLKRNLGINKSSKIRSDLLWEKYRKINQIFQNNPSKIGRFGTFFCTAYIAEQEPSLIKQIASDGHEIACHYFYHDNVNTQSSSEFDLNLRKAKELLEIVSGREVIGFRAPNFAIEKNFPNM